MNNKIIVVWGIIIIILVSIIYYIGITYQNEIKYISLKEEVKIRWTTKNKKLFIKI